MLEFTWSRLKINFVFSEIIPIFALIFNLKDMKARIFKIMMAVAVMLLVCVGCKKNNGSDNGHGLSNMKFKKMDLTHATMLALADTPAKDDSEYTPLYIVNEQGILESVEYTIEVEGDEGTANLVKANLQLKIHYIYQIGEDWIWLFDCRHFYPGIEELDAETQQAINDLIYKYDGIHYLVRKTDGAIFKWSLEDGRPYNIVNYGLERPTDFYGIVEQYGNDIVEIKWKEDDSQIYYLKDNGNNISVTTMIPTGIYPESVYPASDDGVVGAMIGYNINSQGYWNIQPFVIFPDDYTIRQVVVPNYNGSLYTQSQLLSVNDKLYVMTYNNYENNSETDFRKVEIDVANKTVDVSAPIISVNYTVDLTLGTVGYYHPVFHGTTMSWLQNDNINCLNLTNGWSNIQPLPEYFPSDARQYTNGVAYVLDNESNPTVFRVCDMAVGFAMNHNITWDDLGEYASLIVLGSYSEWEFNYNSLTFNSNCMLIDGRKLNFYFSVIGNDAGQVHIIAEGEGGGAGRVISTLIRLNGGN